MALTFDVFMPPGEPNGAGILNMVSGGWISRWRAPEQARREALLDKGFTVFSIRHGSSPRFNAAEAYGDVNRALRFVRHEGDPEATDEVLRVSSDVAAVVAYYPPVDLRKRDSPSEGFPATFPDSSLSFGRGLVMPATSDRFVALRLEDQLAASVSPILFVSSDDPPTLLIHGDADVLVDLNYSQLIHAALTRVGVETDLVVIEGAGHGFRTEEHRTLASHALVGWFEKHLRAR